MHFLDRERVLNLAHRGASAAAPPNTLAAFEKAAELGADGIELDVQLSADSVPVVIHDFTVDGTTDGTGRVDHLPLAQLRELDAGSSFDPRFRGERIPTLEQVLATAGRHLLLNIELKTASLGDDGLERAVVAQVEHHGLDDGRVLFSSFNPIALRRAKKMAPHIPVGWLHAPNLPLPLRRLWLAPFVPHEARHPEYTMVNTEYVTQAHRRGLLVNTWTVDEPDTMIRLIDLGVDCIITNRPDVLRGIIEASA